MFGSGQSLPRTSFHTFISVRLLASDGCLHSINRFSTAERVHIVWASVEGRGRLKSPVDVVSLYAVVIALKIAGKICPRVNSVLATFLGRSSILRSGDDVSLPPMTCV